MAKKGSKADLVELYEQEVRILDKEKKLYEMNLRFIKSLYDDTGQYETINCDLIDAHHLALILGKKDMSLIMDGRKNKKLAESYQSSIACADRSYCELNQKTGSLNPDMNLDEACQAYYQECYSAEALRSGNIVEHTRNVTRSFRQYLQIWIKYMEEMTEVYVDAMRSGLKEVYGERIFNN